MTEPTTEQDLATLGHLALKHGQRFVCKGCSDAAAALTRLRATIANLRTELEALRAAPVYPDTMPRERDGCPCLLVGPCGSSCSCVSQFQSGGCRRCAKYGAPEERLSSAKYIDEMMRAGFNAAAPVPTASPWVSVEERMPDKLTPVLVAGGCAYFDGDDWHTLMEPDHRAIQWTVTYWMPLPAPPVEPTSRPT